jgi:hypothetical protein
MVVSKILWVLTGLSASIAGLLLVFGVVSAKGVPQEAAVAAIAAALCIIPYVFSRSWDGVIRGN